MRWLVRFGYDGTGFDGWARQPGRRTVEGEILRGLGRPGSRPDASGEVSGIEVASRTDRGVSARANALGLRAEMSPVTLLRRLNGISPEIFFTAITEIPAEFRVRGAIRRIYRYFDPVPPQDRSRWTDGAALFSGTIDVRSFGRGIPSGTPRRMTVESVTVARWGPGNVIEIRAPSFVWGMVRKVVGALREHDRGRLTLAGLRAAVEGRERLTLPMAEPEGLVLWNVEYAVPWDSYWTGPNRHQASFLESARKGMQVRAAVLDTVSELAGPSRE
jgi:tRNA pseudouridine38-40 synthase